mgnify:CR=1 FL=1
MSLKQSNEITLKIKCNIEEFYKILEEKNFKIIDEFFMNDIYFIPENLNIYEMSTREILSKALIIRDISGNMSDKITKKITFKIKNIDENGNILSQEAINCDILNINDAMKLLEAIGYKKIMNIKENDVVYEKNGFKLAVKDIVDGDKLIEIETEEDNIELDTIDKLIKKVDEFNIPVCKDNFFVKKAEVELNKVLKR